jgi:hypothetical protein
MGWLAMIMIVVENAINESKRTHSIIRITKTELQQARLTSRDVCTELLAECEGNVEANDVEEFWGQDCDGVEWRVHVALGID